MVQTAWPVCDMQEKLDYQLVPNPPPGRQLAAGPSTERQDEGNMLVQDPRAAPTPAADI